MSRSSLERNTPHSAPTARAFEALPPASALGPAELNLMATRAQLLASSVGIYTAMGSSCVTLADALTAGGGRPPVVEDAMPPLFGPSPNEPRSAGGVIETE
jgi:hypothetical protein